MTDTADRRLELMGTRIRILVGPPQRPDLPTAGEAAARVESFLRDYDRALSRFKPDSELSHLNADPHPEVPASPLLRSALAAALGAARASGGLVDPTLHDALHEAGYAQTWDKSRRLSLPNALAATTARRTPARPHPDARWQQIGLDEERAVVTRPPGLRIDTGGTGKGHAADLAARMLDGYAHWAVDCGGDVRMGGAPRRVDVECPFTGELRPGFTVTGGAVATSGLSSRIWLGEDGTIAHHLLDPATGRPCFTGLVAVTALARSGVEAETLAKTALLQGPHGARRVLARQGGVLFHESGQLERIEPRAGLRVRLPELRVA